VLGTLNNCGGGITPWGTVLSGEENFNQYFGNADLVTDSTTKARLARYGLRGLASERKRERFDRRFDVSLEPNETNRHGWVIEIDPFDPDFVPRKRTALGRFKHEARLTRDGRVVLYMGDDERFDYFYKFVSTNRMRKGDSKEARRHNLSLLDEGTVAARTTASTRRTPARTALRPSPHPPAPTRRRTTPANPPARFRTTPRQPAPNRYNTPQLVISVMHRTISTRQSPARCRVSDSANVAASVTVARSTTA
jgi:hypothetical protein